MTDDAFRSSALRAAAGALAVFVFSSACAPGAVFDEGVQAQSSPEIWPVDALEAGAFDDLAVLDELRRRARGQHPALQALIRVYTEAGLLASSGDRNAFAVVRYGVDAGDPSALHHYALFLLAGSSALGLRPQPVLAADLLRRARDLGFEDSAVELCRGFVHGWRGSYPRIAPPGGVELCEGLAFTGHLDGLVLTGDLYRLGVGAPADVDRAVLFYSVAAAARSPEANYHLAVLGAAGLVGESTAETAAIVLGHFHAAVSLGYRPAVLPAVRFLESGPEMVRDPAAAFALWEMAQARGIPGAGWGLARAFRCGTAVPQSPVDEEFWRAQASRAQPAPRVALITLSPARGPLPRCVDTMAVPPASFFPVV